MLGGGITGTPLGQRMVGGARRLLSDWPELEIFEMARVVDDAGALGALSLIPVDLRRRIEQEPSRSGWPPP